MSGPRSAARPRGQGVWAGLVHPASPGSAKGPTHRAHHDRDQWPWGARGARTEERQSEACGVPGIRRPGAGVPDPIHTQCGKVAGLSAPTRVHPFHSEALGTRATLAPWWCGKDFGLGFGMWGRAGSFLGPLRRVSERTLKRFFFFFLLSSPSSIFIFQGSDSSRALGVEIKVEGGQS